LNRWPADYESAALPTELRRLDFDSKWGRSQRKGLRGAELCSDWTSEVRPYAM